MLLVKNPQFQTNQADILGKLHTHELIILTNFHNDSAKIVDFSSISYFGGWVKFFYSVSTTMHLSLYFPMIMYQGFQVVLPLGRL